MAVLSLAPIHALAQASNTTSENQATSALSEEFLRENQELRYARDIAEIRNALVEANSNDLENLIAVFALLIAVATIVFTWRFGKSTVEEAKTAAILEARRGIKAELDELATLLKDAREGVEEIRKYRFTAKQLLEDSAPGSVPEDERKQDSLRDIANHALNKSKRDRDIDEYRALVSISLIDKSWKDLENRASEMELLFGDEGDDEDLAFAAFYVAYSLGEQGQNSRSVDKYLSLIQKYSNKNGERLKELVAKAWVNIGVRYDLLGNLTKELNAYEEVIEKFGDSNDLRLMEPIAQALSNKAIALISDGQIDKGISTCGQLIDRFGDSDDIRMREHVNRAYFDLACGHALKRQVAKSIDALRQLRLRTGLLDCEAINADDDFNAVRDRPTFRRFLTENGCGQ